MFLGKWFHITHIIILVPTIGLQNTQEQLNKQNIQILITFNHNVKKRKKIKANILTIQPEI